MRVEASPSELTYTLIHYWYTVKELFSDDPI